MTAIQGQLGAKAIGASRRAAPRRKLHLVAEGLVASGLSNVLILDISTTGVLLRANGDLKEGETIELDIPEAIGTRAVVKWSDGQVFGCKFQEPISKAAISAALLRSSSGAPGGAYASPDNSALADDAGSNWVLGLTILSWGVVIAAAAPILWPW